MCSLRGTDLRDSPPSRTRLRMRPALGRLPNSVRQLRFRHTWATRSSSAALPFRPSVRAAPADHSRVQAKHSVTPLPGRSHASVELPAMQVHHGQFARFGGSRAGRGPRHTRASPSRACCGLIPAVHALGRLRQSLCHGKHTGACPAQAHRAAPRACVAATSTCRHCFFGAG